MVEHLAVNPARVGSNPISHPFVTIALRVCWKHDSLRSWRTGFDSLAGYFSRGGTDIDHFPDSDYLPQFHR